MTQNADVASVNPSAPPLWAFLRGAATSSRFLRSWKSFGNPPSIMNSRSFFSLFLFLFHTFFPLYKVGVKVSAAILIWEILGVHSFLSIFVFSVTLFPFFDYTYKYTPCIHALKLLLCLLMSNEGEGEWKEWNYAHKRNFRNLLNLCSPPYRDINLNAAALYPL